MRVRTGDDCEKNMSIMNHRKPLVNGNKRSSSAALHSTVSHTTPTHLTISACGESPSPHYPSVIIPRLTSVRCRCRPPAAPPFPQFSTFNIFFPGTGFGTTKGKRRLVLTVVINIHGICSHDSGD